MHSSNKSFNFGTYVSNDQVLNKRIPGNPKYQHVKPAVNSGSTVQKQIDELREKQKNSLHKKDEVFNRIKFLSFIELLVEAAKVKVKMDKGKSHDCNDLENSVKASDNKYPDKILPNVIMGIGEIDLANQKKNPSSSIHKLEKELPYLLLDVRDKEQFVQNHIKTAIHYPSALLARSVGFETEEMKLYKNSSPEIIIVYDDDESIAVRVATTLVQRGYDNIFVLTGGLKHCLTVFPKKPLSHLCTNQSSVSGSSAVVVKNDFSELSQEDIDVIEQYLDYPKHEHNIQNTRSGSSLSGSRKLELNRGDEVPGLKYKPGSLTYRRRDSDSSLKSIDQAGLKLTKSAIESRSKGGKKAPWK